MLKFNKSSGTKYLWEHYKKHATTEKPNQLCCDNDIASIPTNNNETPSNVIKKYLKMGKKRIIKQGVMMCTQDMRPFNIIKGEGFQSFCQYLLALKAGFVVKDIFPSVPVSIRYFEILVYSGIYNSK